MTIPPELRINEWLALPAPVGSWRNRARNIMVQTVRYHTLYTPLDRDALLKLVDAAYPFGPRSHHPYKAWLTERKVLVSYLTEPLPEPTDEDYAACEVAIDLVESERPIEALALLSSQAPRRMNRDCPVCGVKRYRDCVDPGSGGPRIVPHLARVMPTKANGPLFGSRP